MTHQDQIDPTLGRSARRKKSKLLVNIEEDYVLPERLKAFRKSRGWNQRDLAEACGVAQATVSPWEVGRTRPSATALAAIASLADDLERPGWIAASGVSRIFGSEASLFRTVPVLSANAGTSPIIDEETIETQLILPADWLPRNGRTYGIRATDGSMAPVISSGDLVLVDLMQTNPRLLVDRMVVVADQICLTVKWLRQSGDLFVLESQSISLLHPRIMFRPDKEWKIIGAVIMWIGGVT